MDCLSRAGHFVASNKMVRGHEITKCDLKRMLLSAANSVLRECIAVHDFLHARVSPVERFNVLLKSVIRPVAVRQVPRNHGLGRPLGAFAFSGLPLVCSQ
jgi:hypothetical protein